MEGKEATLEFEEFICMYVRVESDRLGNRATPGTRMTRSPTLERERPVQMSIAHQAFHDPGIADRR
jgi:hypothetical protein